MLHECSEGSFWCIGKPGSVRKPEETKSRTGASHSFRTKIPVMGVDVYLRPVGVSPFQRNGSPFQRDGVAGRLLCLPTLFEAFRH
jgi:hypothetical protein